MCSLVGVRATLVPERATPPAGDCARTSIKIDHVPLAEAEVITYRHKENVLLEADKR